jgi:hypothetical protein
MQECDGGMLGSGMADQPGSSGLLGLGSDDDGGSGNDDISDVRLDVDVVDVDDGDGGGGLWGLGAAGADGDSEMGSEMGGSQPPPGLFGLSAPSPVPIPGPAPVHVPSSVPSRNFLDPAVSPTAAVDADKPGALQVPVAVSDSRALCLVCGLPPCVCVV